MDPLASFDLTGRVADGAIEHRPELTSGINVRGGLNVHPALKAALSAG